MNIADIAIGAGGGLVLEGVIIFVVQKTVLKKRSAKILTDAETQGEAMKKEKILQAKERFLQLKEEHEKTVLLTQ